MKCTDAEPEEELESITFKRLAKLNDFSRFYNQMIKWSLTIQNVVVADLFLLLNKYNISLRLPPHQMFIPQDEVQGGEQRMGLNSRMDTACNLSNKFCGFDLPDPRMCRPRSAGPHRESSGLKRACHPGRQINRTHSQNDCDSMNHTTRREREFRRVGVEKPDAIINMWGHRFLGAILEKQWHPKKR